MALNRQHRYLVAGAAWALLLGPCAAIVAFSFAAGASWLWLFGDDPWPQYTQWALPLIGVIGGVAVAVACIAIAIAAPRQGNWRGEQISRREARDLSLMTAIPFVLICAIGALIAKESADYRRAMAVATEREAAFASLMALRHRIEAVDVEPIAAGIFRASVRLAGSREGPYRLNWHIEEPNFAMELASGARTVELGPGVGQEVRFEFALAELAQRYRDEIAPAGGVLIDEDFVLKVFLEPALSESEHAMLPQGERRNLEVAYRLCASRAAPCFRPAS